MADQFSSVRGTLLFALFTEHGLYLAADSRGSEYSPQYPTNDAACKIFRCGTSAFVAIANTLVARSEKRIIHEKKLKCTAMLDLTVVLEEASEQYVGNETDLTGHIAFSIYQPLTAYWDFMKPPADMVSETLGGSLSFCTILIASRLEGTSQLTQIEFPFSLTHGLLQPIRRIFTAQDGPMQLCGPCPSLESLRLDTSSPMAAQKSIEAIYDLAKSARPDIIGGPVEIGIVNENRAKWIFRKRDLNGVPADNPKPP